MRFLFPLIGYLCVGTVISAAVGVGYLRYTNKLDDERAFRIIALLHGVDLDEKSKEQELRPAETPPEELSYDQQMRQLQESTLDFDVKQRMLAVSLAEFQSQLKRLDAQTNHYANLRTDVENYLKAQNQQVADESLQKVVRQLEGMNPKKQVRPWLIEHIESGRVEEVITILGSMTTRVQRDVLKSFDTPEDIALLHKIHSKMLSGEPVKPYIEEQLNALEQLKQQDQ
jgi:uncharacterized protein YdiU (UPF0061 family)